MPLGGAYLQSRGDEMTATWIKRTSAVLLVTMGVMSLPVHAEVISTQAAIAQAGQVTRATEQERADLVAFMARSDVQAQLTSLGVNPADAKSRVASLSDDEVMQLHGKMKQMPAGGDILGVLVFLFVLLLITDILGLTKVFPFTRSIRH